jgi:serine protease
VLASLGYDFVGSKADPVDPMRGQYPGHGAATASVIMSARGRGSEPQVDGIAPGARLVPLRVSDSVIHISFANVRKAVLHAAGHVQVISMSLGGPFPSRALRRALAQAAERGVITVAAAGNQYPFVVYPARYPEVLAVAASNCARAAWKNTTRGSAVDCSAPGETVWRAQSRLVKGVPRYDVAPSSGSSYAAAIVAGVCALWVDHRGHQALFQRYGAKLAAAFRKVVMEAGCETPSGWDDDTLGAGIIHAGKVLAARLPAGSTVRVPAAPTATESAVDYFPALEPDAALAAITAGVPQGKRGGVRRAFDIAGDELLFQLGSNAQLRAVIYERATRKATRGRATRSAPSRAIKLDASPTFRETFGF